MATRLRAGIAGTGFIAKVHAHAVPRRGRRGRRGARQQPATTRRASTRCTGDAGRRRHRGAAPPPTSTWCTSARRTPPTSRWRVRRSSAASPSSARSRSPPRSRTPARWSTAARAAQTVTAGAVRLPLLRLRPRGPRPDRPRRGRAGVAAARHLPAGLAVLGADYQLARGPGAGRGFHGRSGTSACTGATSWSSRPASGSCGCARDAALAHGVGPSWPTWHRGRRRRHVRNRCREQSARCRLARCPQDARTGCGSPSTDPTPRTPLTRRSRSKCGSAGATRTVVVLRGTDNFGRPPSTSSGCPPGTRRATRTRSALSSQTCTPPRGRPKPDGLPTFDEGLRAAVLTQAVVDAAGPRHGWRCLQVRRPRPRCWS